MGIGDDLQSGLNSVTGLISENPLASTGIAVAAGAALGAAATGVIIGAVKKKKKKSKKSSKKNKKKAKRKAVENSNLEVKLTEKSICLARGSVELQAGESSDNLIPQEKEKTLPTEE